MQFQIIILCTNYYIECTIYLKWGNELVNHMHDLVNRGNVLVTRGKTRFSKTREWISKSCVQLTFFHACHVWGSVHPSVMLTTCKVKPKHFDRHLVADCSIDHKPRNLHVNKWDVSQTKSSNCTLMKFFPKMVSVIFGGSCHAKK